MTNLITIIASIGEWALWSIGILMVVLFTAMVVAFLPAFLRSGK
jgi:hypothetical protein